MTNFKVIEVELKSTPNGKNLKKVTLKGEEQDHLEPRVTIWENHPEFKNAEVGADIKGVLEKKDSGKEIPDHPGKNYIERTLLPEGSETSSETSDNRSILIGIDLKLDRIMSMLSKPKIDTVDLDSVDSQEPDSEDEPF